MMTYMDTTTALHTFKPAAIKHARIVHRWPRIAREYGIDDLLQEAQLAIIEACNNYNPEKGTKFSTYVIQCIRWKLGSLLSIHNRTPMASLEVMMENGYDKEQAVTVSSSVDMSFLSDAERDMVSRHYLSGETYAVIGEDYGITGSRVQQIVAAALPKLRKRNAQI